MTKLYKEMQVLLTDKNHDSVFNTLYFNFIRNILRRERFDKDLFPEKDFIKLKKLRTFLIEKCSKTDWLGIYALKEE